MDRKSIPIIHVLYVVNVKLMNSLSPLHPLVVRCMKEIFQLKPSLPKYEIWCVRVVLDYLKTFGVSSILPLKDR